MTKTIALAGTAALLTLAGCHAGDNQVGANMVNAQDVVASSLDNQAAALDNRADALRNQADMTRDWSKDKQKAMKKAAKDGLPLNESTMNQM